MNKAVQERMAFLQKILDQTALIIMLFCCLPFLLLYWYTGMVADDYAFATKVTSQGFWQAQQHWYMTWTGRYTSSALISLATSSNYYGSLLGSLPILLGCSFFYFLSSIIKSRTKTIKLALGMTLLFLLTMPSPSEGLYWMSGSITYLLPAVLTLFILGIILSFPKRSNYKKAVLFFVGVLLSSLIIGSNEVAMVFLFSLYGSLLFLADKKEYYIWLIALLILCLGFSLVVVLAPGNEFRTGLSTNQKPLIYPIIMSVIYALSVFSKWILYTPTFALSIVYLFVGNLSIKKASNGLSPKLKKYPLTILLWFVTVLILCSFLSFWAQNKPLPDRALNYLYLLFLPFWFIFLTVMSEKYTHFIPKKNNLARASCYVVLLLLPFGSINFQYAGNDLISGNAQEFYLQQQKRMKILQQCKTKHCTVKPITTIPRSIFFKEIKKDTSFWVNITIANFHQKESVRLE